MSYPEADHNPHARPGAFTRPDEEGMATEAQVSDFLANVVRLIKPRIVVETGTYQAHTTEAIYRALLEQAWDASLSGHLHTYEIDPDTHAAAVQKILEITDQESSYLDTPTGALLAGVTLHNTRVQADPPNGAIDLAFVDSGWLDREAEVAFLLPRMSPQGLLFVHDTAKPPLRQLTAAWRRRHHVIQFPTPRGLVVLQAR